MMEASSSPGHRPPRRGPIDLLLAPFSSVWFGIVLMVLIFLYLTVGSAGIIYPTSVNIFDSANWRYELCRTWSWIDKTEMEFFAWWPFKLLIGLFTLNIIVVTLRRIRFNLMNLGVWTIHTGIVTLVAGSVYYFHTKVEGDTPVFRRSIEIEAPGAASPVRLVVATGNATSVDTPAGRYDFRITDINPTWPLLSGEDKGKTACSVNVSVKTPTDSFVRQMLMKYPQYTEDIIPGKGRAIKSLGKKLVDDALAMHFVYEPQTEFYLMHSAALYVRNLGDREWTERPLDDLPHFSDHISSLTEIWQPEGDPVIQPNPLDIPVPPASADDPIGDDLDIRVTGRLRYSSGDDMRPVPGGSQLNPVLGVRLTSGSGSTDRELVAFDPRMRDTDGGLLSFRWATSEDEIGQLAEGVGARVKVSVPAANANFAIPVDEHAPRDPQAAFIPIQGTDWSYRVGRVQRNLEIGNGQTVSLAIMEFQNGERIITRWVADDPARTRDVTEDHGMSAPDPDIHAEFEPGSVVMLIGGPGPADLHLVLNEPENRVQLQVGKPFTLGDASERGQRLQLTATHLYQNAAFKRRPTVTPRSQRRGDINSEPFASRIKVLLQMPDKNWSKELWLDYNRYPLSTAQYAVQGRFHYAPDVVTLPDGRQIELLFSRQRYPLPNAVTLEDFELLTHAGGYIPNQTTTVRDFVSRLRAFRDGKWSEVFTTSLNKPASDAGWYYFQSEWDPGEMAYTVLGVGNRNGVHAQLAGTGIVVAGLIFVFYLKPIIKRRQRNKVWSAVAQEQGKAAVPEPANV